MNRVWLITGASSGFGRCIAEEALSRGELVMATARNLSAAEAVAGQFPNLARAARLDVTDAASIQRAVQDTLDWAGQIDVLVNNAGRGLHGAIEETSDREARALFDTNIFGLLALIRAALPGMRERESGYIINLGSVAGLVPGAGSGLYAATKSALASISEALSAEVAPFGLRVTNIEPGPFRTEFQGRSIRMAERSIPAYAPTAGKRTADLRRGSGRQPGDPRKAARVICDLAGEANPPLRLVLGSSAIDRARQKLANLAGEISEWEDVSRATAFDEETAEG
jgi:NADP-dependent 3-hydroxy acid dehydrogenase YdfG